MKRKERCLSWRLAPVEVSREKIAHSKENNESQIMFVENDNGSVPSPRKTERENPFKENPPETPGIVSLPCNCPEQIETLRKKVKKKER